jgi:hypothetical protein
MCPAWKGVTAEVLTGVTGTSRLANPVLLLAPLIPLLTRVVELLVVEEEA